MADLSKIINRDAAKAFQDLLDENGSVGKDQIKFDRLPAQMGNDLEGDSFAIDIYQPDLYECATALYGSEVEARHDHDALLALCKNHKLFKVPCSWQMYGHIEVRAEDWDEAIDKAESDEYPLPVGSYVESSFEIDHAIIEDERENEA